MNGTRKHIIHNFLSTFLVVLLLFPSMVSFAHIFEHDNHHHCTETSTTHFHEKPADCELCDVHLSPVLTVSVFEENPFREQHFVAVSSSYNLLISQYQQLHFYLRGPPHQV